jgi:RNA polymerase sigma-70 factor (ECF subfamily)
MTLAEAFEEQRPLLLGIAYRLLGSMWDAEDVVQDAYLRWMRADRASVREPRAFLTVVVSRLALDQLRSARVTREAYVGPWLPEPVSADAFGPLDTVELRDTLSYATLHLMERLTPPERAAFVLREAFQLPYDQIAEILGTRAENCRQLHHRAARHLAGGRDRFQPSATDHTALLRRFLEAAQNGDLESLTGLLADDVSAWNDGGGKVRAPLRPVLGRSNVLAFMAGLMTRYPLGETTIVAANGEPALRMNMGGQDQLVAFGIREGRIQAIFTVRNPDKLTRLASLS